MNLRLAPTNPPAPTTKTSVNPFNAGVIISHRANELRWEVPDPDSASCSIVGRTFGVSFQAADESSTIAMAGSVVRTTLPDSNGSVAT